MNSKSDSLFLSKLRLSNPVLGCILLAVVFVCLYPTLGNLWVNWDDPAYVLRNALVQDLSQNGIAKMFTTSHQVGLYHPVTLLSLAFDYHFWGTDAFGFHLTNLILHLINVLLVFTLLKKLKLSIFIAFTGALLFGMHPMHVESVAWISARKDVLYTLFFLISLIAYLNYIKKEGKASFIWYSIALLAFVLSLLSKSLSFTLPIILLLIDYLMERKWTLKIFLEKTPFIVLALIALIVAKNGQESSDSIVNGIGLSKSVFIGSYNVLEYGFKSIAPINLSIFHPFPAIESSQLSGLIYASIIPLLALPYFLYRWFHASKLLFFGVSFYLVSITPVSQIIPFGKAISSERYTYVAYIGLFILIALGIQKLWEKFSGSNRKYVVTAIVLIWFCLLGYQTNIQSKVWKNGEVLWSSVIEKYPDSEWAYMSRGLYRLENGNFEGAKSDLRTSVSIKPIAQSLYELGYLYEREGTVSEAFKCYNESLMLDDSYSKSHLNIAVLYANTRDLEKASHHFKRAVEIDDSYGLAHFNLGIYYKIKGQLNQSLKSYQKSVELEPKNGLYRRHLGVLLHQMQKYELAIKEFEEVIPLEPKSLEPYYLRAQSYLEMGKLELARQDIEKIQSKGVLVPEEFLLRLNQQK